MVASARPAARFLSASIAKKVITAITGLALCLFLVGHLAGNLLLIWVTRTDPSSDRFGRFNGYAKFLNSLPFLTLIELGLLAIFLLHAYQALKVTRENYQARPERYQYKQWGRTKSPASRKTWSSTFMGVSGTLILVFTILHVWHFKYNRFQEMPVVGATSGSGMAMAGTGSEQSTHDLAGVVIESFQSPIVVLLYVFAMLNLGAHLWHAVWSAFQTLGVSNPKWRHALIWFGNIFTIVITAGFTIIPIWAYFIASR